MPSVMALLQDGSDLQSIAKWDSRFLTLAKLISTWSKDPSTQVGAVIVNAENHIISLGYNGLPRGVKDAHERLNDRPTKYKMIRHAEANAMDFAERSLEGCTLYTYPFMPCSQCAGQVIQRRIKEVVSYQNNAERWAADFDLTMKMFEEAGVALRLLEAPTLENI